MVRILCVLLFATACRGNASDPSLLAPTGNAAYAAPVAGIHCDSIEQLAFHIHAHVAVFDHDEEKSLPAHIGISSTCISWLHTHDESGIIHIESPMVRTYTLGDFFAVWGQPLGSAEVGPALGPVTAFVDGAPITADPASIELVDKRVIQLDIGKPAPPQQPYQWPSGF